VFCIILFAGCGRDPGGAGSRDRKKITIDVSPLLGSAALYIAHEKGYFQEEGLEATLQIHASGQLSLQAVLAGEADFAAVAETPIAYAAVGGRPLAVVATISRIERATLIVARKDRGISQAADLKGKKIGVVPGTAGDFFLHIYLTTSYIDPKEVRIVSLPPDEVVNALLAGAVDAVSTWSPQTIALQDQLGGNAVILDEPGLYTLTWNLVVARDFTRRDPDAIVRVLRAIVRANRFIARQPEEARAVTARNLGADLAAVEREWANCKPTAVLDQDLILDLEDQARWILKKEAVGKEVPNFLEFIDTRGLRTVAPDAVRMVEGRE
jgi:NitT/TauT family transport system substrate-binding protein